MPVDIRLENCTLNDNASVIRYYNDSAEAETIQREIERAQKRVSNEELMAALEELKTAVEKNNKATIKKVITDFAVQFSSNLFANIAGSNLLSLVAMFLPKG